VEEDLVAGTWREALLKLHARGWNTDEIDAACETLAEACEAGAFQGAGIGELSAEQVGSVLESALPAAETEALRRVADLRHRVGKEADALRAALYDLDAFACEFGGDD
jgi:hypothetical protein